MIDLSPSAPFKGNLLRPFIFKYQGPIVGHGLGQFFTESITIKKDGNNNPRISITCTLNSALIFH